MTDTAYTRLFRSEALEYHATARGDTGSLTHSAARWTRHGLSMVLGAGLLMGVAVASLPVEYSTGYTASVVDISSHGLVVALEADAPALEDGQALRLGLNDSARTLWPASIAATGSRVVCVDPENMECLSSFNVAELSGQPGLLLLRLAPKTQADEITGPEPGEPVTLWVTRPRQRLWAMVAENMGWTDNAG